MKLILVAVVALCVAQASASIFAATHTNKVESDACENCKDFWDYIVKALAKHQKAASTFVCGGLSNHAFRIACDEVMKYYMKGASKRMDSEQVCKEIKQCPEDSPSLRRTFTFNSNKGNVLKFTPES